MAIELCSENPISMMSPRISFSHDLSQSDTIPVEQYLLRSLSSTSSDFNFCISEKSDHGSSSADELFADGKIIPSEIKPTKPKTHFPKTEKTAEKTPVTEKQSISENDSKKSFWGFKRSSSLNCGSGYARSLCPLPPLSRSNSTGSNSVKKSSISSKEGFNKGNSQKQSNLYQKPPLRKNGIRVNPVLNVPSANMFGLGSIFSGNKDKSKKK